MTREYIQAVNKAIELAESGKPESVASFLSGIAGMSSKKGRLFLNGLCSGLGSINYLEIGCWAGSTLVSAMYKNPDANGFGIDNFSEFVQSESQPINVRGALNGNLKKIPNARFFESDCWAFDKSQLPLIDVYFYDGKHDEDSQYKALTEFDSVLADTFILIVDDWEFKPRYYDVKIGTLRAARDLDYEIIQSWYLQKAKGYHEGMFVALIRRRTLGGNK